MDETRSIEILAPFLPREQLIELCSGRRAFAAWREKKLNDARYRFELAWRRQRQLARRNQERPMRFVDGAGYHRLTIDDELEMRARLVYGRHCWQDPDFKKRVERDHPEMRVPSPPRRFHPVNGFRDHGKTLKSVPRYGVRGEPGPGVSLRTSHETAAAPISTE